MLAQCSPGTGGNGLLPALGMPYSTYRDKSMGDTNAKPTGLGLEAWSSVHANPMYRLQTYTLGAIPGTLVVETACEAGGQAAA